MSRITISTVTRRDFVLMAALQRALRLRAMPLGFEVRNALEALQFRSMRQLYIITKNQTAIRYLLKMGAALAVLVHGSISVALADDLTGQASIIDGDTLEIHGTSIRLWGVDAPESRRSPLSTMPAALNVSVPPPTTKLPAPTVSTEVAP